jgi:hypothetical protein
MEIELLIVFYTPHSKKKALQGFFLYHTKYMETMFPMLQLWIKT